MEFNFNIEDILPGRITVVESKDSNSILTIYDVESDNSNEERSDSWICNLSSNTIGILNNLRRKKESLENIIDKMGHASAWAQDLLSPITTFKKLLNSSQQKIYIIRDVEAPYSVIGILKIGLKRLFICDDIGAHREVDAICVLDFYVHESKQRCGFGHELFDIMLKVEKIEPSKLAVDRPSFKFLAFLKKHYGLTDPRSQANNYVVYSGFFNDKQITRPPIFLYNKKALHMSNRSTSKQNCCQDNSNMMRSLDTVQTIPVSLPNDKKSKTFDSSAGNCLHKSDGNTGLDAHFRKRRVPSMPSYNQAPTTSEFLRLPNFSDLNKGEKNWGVYDAMHSYSENDSYSNDWLKTHPSQCSLTPIDHASMSTQKKWNESQSSWNILGVESPDYSVTPKKS